MKSRVLLTGIFSMTMLFANAQETTTAEKEMALKRQDSIAKADAAQLQLQKEAEKKAHLAEWPRSLVNLQHQ